MQLMQWISAADQCVEHQIKCTKKIKLNAKRNNVKFNSIQIVYKYDI